MTSLLLLSNFYPVTSYRRVRKKKKGTNILHTIRSLVTVRNQLPAQGVNQSPILVNRLLLRPVLAPKGAFTIYFQGTVNTLSVGHW